MSSPTNQSQNEARAIVQAELKDICKNLVRYKELNNDQKDALMLDSVYLLKKTYRLEGEGSSKESGEGARSDLFSELEETVYDITGKIMKYMDDFPLTLDKAKDEEGEYVMI